jgi:hypothetical protein
MKLTDLADKRQSNSTETLERKIPKKHKDTLQLMKRHQENLLTSQDKEMTVVDMGTMRKKKPASRNYKTPERLVSLRVLAQLKDETAFFNHPLVHDFKSIQITDTPAKKISRVSSAVRLPFKDATKISRIKSSKSPDRQPVS